MAFLTKGKHTVSEIEGVRCSLVESGVSDERMNYLKDILEASKLEVKSQKAEDGTYTIGVTNLLFNPMIAIYERSLKAKDGQIVSPAIWRQQTSKYESRYWRFRN